MAYQIEIRENRGRMWLPILKEANVQPFVVGDGTGFLRVDIDSGDVRFLEGPPNIQMNLGSRLELRTGLFAQRSQALERFMLSRQLERSRWTALVCIESLLRSSQAVDIVGIANVIGDVEQNVNRDDNRVVRVAIVGTKDTPVYLETE